MQKFGFLDSMSPAEAKNFIEDRRSQVPIPNEEKVAAYLRQAPVWMASAGIAKDVLTASKAIGPLNVRSDGVWAWTDDMAYYVRKYHLSVPEAFVRHMEQSDWLPPESVDFSALSPAEVLSVTTKP